LQIIIADGCCAGLMLVFDYPIRRKNAAIGDMFPRR
jgi:hypothetical protein